MEDEKDCLQPVLNAWMYFLETWELPRWALLLYATRRKSTPDEVHKRHFPTGKPGCISSATGGLNFHEAVKQPWCRRVFSGFAVSAFKEGSRGRYFDDNFLVIDVGALGEATLGLTPGDSVFNGETGCMHVSEEVLKDNRLQLLIGAAGEALTAGQIKG